MFFYCVWAFAWEIICVNQIKKIKTLKIRYISSNYSCCVNNFIINLHYNFHRNLRYNPHYY